MLFAKQERSLFNGANLCYHCPSEVGKWSICSEKGLYIVCPIHYNKACLNALCLPRVIKSAVWAEIGKHTYQVWNSETWGVPRTSDSVSHYRAMCRLQWRLPLILHLNYRNIHRSYLRCLFYAGSRVHEMDTPPKWPINLPLIHSLYCNQ